MFVYAVYRMFFKLVSPISFFLNMCRGQTNVRELSGRIIFTVASTFSLRLFV